MEWVILMKKALIVILVLLLILGGLFFRKGGHHAIALFQIMEEWLDADSGDQTLSLSLSVPGARADEAGAVRPHIRQYTLNADTFWTEYADRTLFGLTAQGMTVWTEGKNLYMDTGKAYALPDLSALVREANKLALGLILNGRVTKQADTYRITMKTQDLELDISVTADPHLRSASATALFGDDAALHCSVTPKAPESHPIPREILDAMVRSKMEPPMPLTKPLELLMPALENLLPLTGALELSISCGILEVSEGVRLEVSRDQAALIREGVRMELSMPQGTDALSPAALAVLILRDGEFSEPGLVRLKLSGDVGTDMLEALVPQAAGLGIRLEESELTLHIEADCLTRAEISAAGTVPFLITTIPVAFSALLTPVAP